MLQFVQGFLKGIDPLSEFLILFLDLFLNTCAPAFPWSRKTMSSMTGSVAYVVFLILSCSC